MKQLNFLNKFKVIYVVLSNHYLDHEGISLFSLAHLQDGPMSGLYPHEKNVFSKIIAQIKNKDYMKHIWSQMILKLVPLSYLNPYSRKMLLFIYELF